MALKLVVAEYWDQHRCRKCGEDFEVVDPAYGRRLNRLCSRCVWKAESQRLVRKEKTEFIPLPGSRWEPCYARKHGWRDCKGPLDCDGSCWRGEPAAPVEKPKAAKRSQQMELFK